MNPAFGIRLILVIAPGIVFGGTADVARGQSVADLDDSRNRLTDSFRCDLNEPGSAPDGLEVAKTSKDHVVFSNQGATAALTANGPWSQVDIAARFEVFGDFDVECGFDELELSGSEKSCVMLNFSFENTARQIGRVIRYYEADKPNEFQASLLEVKDEKRLFHLPARKQTESRSGRLRIARRGKQLFYLVAEGTNDFEILHGQDISENKSIPNGVVLQAKGNADAVAKVNWKYIRIHADKLVQPQDSVADLDRELPHLTSVFEHDFSVDGLDEQYFAALDRHRVLTTETVDGLVSSVRSSKNYNGVEISARFEVHGDFDADVTFDALSLSGDDSSHMMLTADFADDPLTICRVMRSKNKEQSDRAYVSRSYLKEGERIYHTSDTIPAARTHGRLRLARRGSAVSYLFADGIDGEWQLLGRRIVSEAPTIINGIRLRNLCRGNSESEVRWKKLTIRASGMMFHRPKDPGRSLVVMKSDGSEMRVVAEPPDGFAQIHSPEWSSDGRRIVFSAEDDDAVFSQLFIAAADGSRKEPLGPGSMASFATNDQELVFYEKPFGLIRMDADGFGRHRISETALGGQASPDGRSVAWVEQKTLLFWNTETDEPQKRVPFNNTSGIRSLYPDVSWSPDGEFVAVAGRTSTGTTRLFVVETAEPGQFRVLYEHEGINPDFSWSPDGQRILFSRNDASEDSSQLFVVDSDGKTAAQRLPGQPVNLSFHDCDWSPDGQQILATISRLPEPVEWIQKPASRN